MRENLAIYGGDKTVKKNFPWPIFDDSDVDAVTQVAQSGQWGNPDCRGLVEKFEAVQRRKSYPHSSKKADCWLIRKRGCGGAT